MELDLLINILNKLKEKGMDTVVGKFENLNDNVFTNCNIEITGNSSTKQVTIWLQGEIK